MKPCIADDHLIVTAVENAAACRAVDVLVVHDIRCVPQHDTHLVL